MNLLDALRQFEKDTVLTETLGQKVSQAYVKLKLAEWNKFTSELTEWERRTTLDC